MQDADHLALPRLVSATGRRAPIARTLDLDFAKGAALLLEGTGAFDGVDTVRAENSASAAKDSLARASHRGAAVAFRNTSRLPVLAHSVLLPCLSG